MKRALQAADDFVGGLFSCWGQKNRKSMQGVQTGAKASQDCKRCRKMLINISRAQTPASKKQNAF